MPWLIRRSIVSGGGVHLWLINELIYTVERGGGGEGGTIRSSELPSTAHDEHPS